MPEFMQRKYSISIQDQRRTRPWLEFQELSTTQSSGIPNIA